MKSNLSSFTFFIVLIFSSCQSSQDNSETAKQPNILLVVADDLAYTDIGAFGGEISTPNLDLLAAKGLAFSRFHTAPMCAVTRAMLLSGNDNHIAGMGSQDLKTNEFGYEGHLTDRIIPMPQILKESGYHTFMTGKWHLGNKKEDNPHYKGFERSFVLLEGGGNHYSNRGIFKEDSISPYTEDGIKAGWPQGAYSTDFYTDKLISYIDKYKDDQKPFFAFAAYTSPHWPLQVDPEYWKKYIGKYDSGYVKLRKERFEKQKSIGLIPQDAILPELHPSVKLWDQLSDNEKLIEARKMELYAGMVDNLDSNIGRLISYLKKIEQYDNTLIIFLSDNGAASEDFYNHEYFGPFLKKHYSEAYKDMGTEKSFVAYGPQWAEAGTAPFKFFKGFTSEGGINTPMIISGPHIKAKGNVSHSFSTILDIAPTLYDLAGTEYPKLYNGKKIYPLKGSSMRASFEDPETNIHDDEYVFALEHRGQILVRKGDWKLVNNIIPVDEDNFVLYNLSDDLAEQKNVKSEFPEVYNELFKEWKKYQTEMQVLIPTPQ